VAYLQIKFHKHRDTLIYNIDANKGQANLVICGRLNQGRIKGFVGTGYFSSLGPFRDSKSIDGIIVYSRLSGLIDGRRYTYNPNFIFYTLTVLLARHGLRNMLLSHTSHFTVGRIVEFWFLEKKCIFEALCFILYKILLLYFYFTSLPLLHRPYNVVGSRHSACSAEWVISLRVWVKRMKKNDSLFYFISEASQKHTCY
jgi:hypothetical protein